MQTLAVLRSITIFTFVLAACSRETQTPLVAPTVLGPAQPSSNVITVRTDSADFGGDIGDTFGQGEIVFYILAIRENGDSRRLSSPGIGTESLSRGQSLDLSSYALAINNVGRSERMFIYFVAFDNDELSFGDEVASSAAINAGMTVLEHALSTTSLGAGPVIAGEVFSHSSIAALILSTVAGAALSWWQEADILGEYGVLLTPEDAWGSGRAYVAPTNNGNMTVRYTITRGDQSEPISILVITSEPQISYVVVTATPEPATDEPRATMTPRPSATPVPSDTAEPVAEIIQTPVKPACTAVTGAFANVWQAVQPAIGCAQGSVISGLVVEENFEYGKMLWREPIDYAQAVTLFAGGTWQIFQHAPFVEGSPDYSCVDSNTPAQSPPTPRRGFGMMWCDIPSIRNGLGNARDVERGFTGNMQQFDNGVMIGTDYNLTYILYSSGYWEAR